VPVDVLHPENNGPVDITHFTDHESKNGDFVVNGHEIVARDNDIRWMSGAQQQFTLVLLGPDEMHLKIPSTSWDFLNNPDAVHKGKELAGANNERVKLAEDVARNEILNNPGRQHKHFILKFPKGTELTNEIFSPASDNGIVASRVVPVVSTVQHGGVSFKSCRVDVVWKIALAEPSKRATKQISAGQNEQEQQMNGLIQSMQNL